MVSLPLRLVASADSAGAPAASASAAAVQVLPSRPVPRNEGSASPLARLLVERGVLAMSDLTRALAMAGRHPERLTDILLANRMVGETDLAQTVASLEKTEFVDPVLTPPDVRLIDRLGAAECLRLGVLPWRDAGALTVILAARPERFEAARASLEPRFGPVRLAIATQSRSHAALLQVRRSSLARRAETLTPAEHSCRGSVARQIGHWLLAFLALSTAAALAAPRAALTTFALWAVLTMLAVAALRTSAAVATLLARRRAQPAAEITPIEGLPVISVLVPLLKEREIAGKLVQRLARLDYPRELLDILLVVEEDDTITQGAIEATRLPPWMRQIVVPRGPVQTKPRALNFALGFCRGTVVGVYDAEDAPAPDQLRLVAARFGAAPPEVACLQGVLDFYNARDNWLSRCFAVEYATWFRVVLPGLSRMGLAVPLGGTTLFFRRNALEALGGWDAHNVTEDADLGFRLARAGLRTELIDTVTEEEATCQPVRWVRQRSRWLKGYAMTWAVHMRDPARLWRELGPWQFTGFQLLFLGTLSQFVLAPVLWSFWLLVFGLPHPLAGLVPPPVMLGLTGVFVLTELLTITVSAWAVATPTHRWLVPWAPTLHVYFPLGALAAYKGLWEMLWRPFYWDKTPHGLTVAQTSSGRAERTAIHLRAAMHRS